MTFKSMSSDKSLLNFQIKDKNFEYDINDEETKMQKSLYE